jgi:hypothetical protein
MCDICFCVQCSTAFVLTVDFCHACTSQNKIYFHGNSVIILYFESCYIATHKFYLVRCINFEGGKFQQKACSTSDTKVVCVVYISVVHRCTVTFYWASS